MKRVFITRRLPPVAADMLRGRFEVVERRENSPCPAEQLLEAVTDCDVILSTVSEKLDRDVLRHGRRLEVVSNYAVGLDNIDLDFARSVSITVYNTPDVVTDSTADLTLALLLILARRIPQAQDYIRQGRWRGWDPERCLGEELSGKVFGILGYGRIGKAVARRAAGFGLQVIYHDVITATGGADPGAAARSVPLDELLETSDYLSLHMPLTAQTRGLINRDAILKMARRPILLNMARGEVVVTADLVGALESGQIRGAALDVVAAEHIDGDHPLCRADNVVLVPHVGTATRECRHNMAELAAGNIVRHYR